MFPIRRRSKKTGLVVEFTSESSGTVIASGTAGDVFTVGDHINGWVRYDSPHWGEMKTQSKRHRIMAKIGEFREN